jgi:hypothetical protein
MTVATVWLCEYLSEIVMPRQLNIAHAVLILTASIQTHTNLLL